MADLSPKATKPIQAFLAERKALIVTRSSSNRPTIRKLCTSFGMKPAQADTAESFKEALKIIETSKPQLIFCEDQLEEGSGAEVFSALKAIYPNRLETIFFLFTEASSPIIANRAAEEDVDAVVIQPLTYDVLEAKFLECLEQKITPTPYQKLLETGKTLLATKTNEQALQVFQKAKEFDSKPSLACFFEGLTHEKMGNPSRAQTSYEEGLKYDQNHYRCLFGLFQLSMDQKQFDKAYEVAATLTSQLPIDPILIPKVIWLSIYRSQLDEVVRYYDVFSKADLSAIGPSVSNHIVAGLIVAGKYFLQHGKPQEGLAALKKAEASSGRRPKLLKEIACALLSTGKNKEAQEFLAKAPEEVRKSPEVILAEFEGIASTLSSAEVIQRATALIEKQILSSKLFQILITHSVEAGRKQATLEDLVATASKHFPEKKDLFESLLKKK